MNIYEVDKIGSNKTPAPLKALMNLTSPISDLKFNPDSQMLAMCASEQQDGLRLVHLPSCTVFSNWPTTKTPVGFVSHIQFSPNGGTLAWGNHRGRAIMYRLMHYQKL